MSATGLDVFDKTIHTTNIWLREVMDDLGPDRSFAWHVLGVVLRGLRDQLPPELAAHLAAQLPLLVRGAFYESWNPGSASRKAKSDSDFLARIEDQLQWSRPSNAQRVVHAVLATLCRHVDKGQLASVRNALAEKVRRLWPQEFLELHGGESAAAGRHAQIQERAFQIWEQVGRPDGEELNHWLQAEQEIGQSNAEPNDHRKGPTRQAARRTRSARPAKRAARTG
jgi:uncharacterized protein (DUF2267 family)